MNKLEEAYKNRFKGQESLQGIDVDDLWEGIAEGLEHSTPTPKRPKMYLRNITIGTAILILLLWGFCSKYNANKENIAEIQNAFLPSNDLEKNPDFAPNLNPDTRPEKEQRFEETSTNKTTEKIAQPYTSTIISKKKARNVDLQKNNLLNKNALEASVFPESIHKAGSSPDLLPIEVSTLKNNNPESIDIFNAATNKQLSQNVTIEALDYLPSLPILPLAIKSAQPDLPIIQNPDYKKPPQVNHFQMGVYSGVNSLFTHYKDKNTNPELWEELTAGNTPEWGLSTSLRLSWLRKGKYSLSTGIDFDNIRVKFQNVKEAETTVLDENYLTGFSIDPQTGDTIDKVYGAVMRRANAKRSVLHHNNFKLISIPLEIGIQQQKRKFGFGINIGISTTFFIAQNGRTLNSNREIQTIDDTIDDELPFRKFSFSYHLNPFVDYEISKRIKLRLSPVVRYQSHGLSGLYGLNQYSVFTSFNGGLVFKL